MRIAFDAHGGDYAPTEIIDGILRAAKEWTDTTFIMLATDESLYPSEMKNIQFHPVTEVIEAEDEPVRAVRRKKESSIVVGCEMVRKGEADAFICAGNTGALMAAGLFYTGRIKGVERPALAPVFPTTQGKGMLVLDVGANPEAKAVHLYQYAQLGNIYAEKVMGIEKPRIGLLNIGAETGKGSTLTREAFSLLKEDKRLHFVGNIEARGILDRPCDVLVCDGFNGNILLKNAEGVAKTIFQQLKEVFMKNWITKLSAAILAPSLKQLKKQMDYREYGGAPLLGVDGPIIKAHGSSDADAIFHAARQARLFVKNDVISKMKEEIFAEKE